MNSLRNKLLLGIGAGIAVGIVATSSLLAHRRRIRRSVPIATTPRPAIVTQFTSIDEWMKSEELYGTLVNEFNAFNLRRIPHKTEKKSFLTVVDNFMSKDVCDRIVKECEGKNFQTTTRFILQSTTKMNQQEIILWSNSDLPENYAEIVKRCEIFDMAQNAPSIKRYVTNLNKNGTSNPHADLPQHTDKARHSLLCYLNDVPSEAGGATTFQDFGDFQPIQGMALFWKTADDPLMVHGARGLKFGSKYILQTQN